MLCFHREMLVQPAHLATQVPKAQKERKEKEVSQESTEQRVLRYLYIILL